MKLIGHIKNKSTLLFLIAIAALCIGFILTACGTEPQTKVALVNDGVYGIDFNASSFTKTVLYAASKMPDQGGKMFDQTGELTVEAWVKRITSGTLKGGILSRYSSGNNDSTGGGVLLLVDNNQPKFMVQTTFYTSTSLSSAVSGATLNVDEWTHIAGVVVNEDHSAVHAECTGGLANIGRAETPHIDIYINGVFANCASTNSLFAGNDGVSGDTSEHRIWVGMITDGVTFNTATPCYSPVLCFDSILTNAKFEGVIDEVRFWTVARSQADIQECMNQELGLTGACKVDNTKLKAYYRMDEGSGHSVADVSGSGLSGSLMDYGNNLETDWPGA
ncbi:MAG: LamG domain-containing protein, partial [Nitrospiraceae bacterium]